MRWCSPAHCCVPPSQRCGRRRRKAVAGARRFDLRAVERIDSAGLAFLSQLATLAGGDVAIDGTPAGLAELSAAYRLSPSLAFAY